MTVPRTIENALVSNGFTLNITRERLGWLVPSSAGLPVKALWEQYQSQGYLWLKGILNRDDVLDFRRRYFAAFASIGLVAPGTDPGAGIYSGQPVDPQSARQVSIEAVRWAAYEAFCLSKPIYRFFEEALGGAVYLHKRKLIRHTRPGDPNCTGAHYDLTYLRAGTDRVYTVWIPIGDIPVEMGGLVYLEGSDAWGRKMEAEFSALNAHLPPEQRISAYNRNMSDTGWLTKDIPSLSDRLDTRWLCADYETGDMVIHSAYMIHAATENRDAGGRMRLSTDIRYQLIADEIDSRWTHDWSPDDEKRF
jgi:ectoine hydroxylase-related dioxygenase (phytanoyl-CoA dioxygenase family)